jgi:hypothetical protein
LDCGHVFEEEAIIEFYATPKGIEGKLNKVFYLLIIKLCFE